MRLKIRVKRNFKDAVRFIDLHYMTHDGRWMLKGFFMQAISESLHSVSLSLEDAPKPLVIQGRSFEMYEKTNLKYAIRKLIRRVR